MAWFGLAGLLVATGPGAASPATPRHLTTDAVYDPQALRALAEQGDKRAAFLLGSRFASGRSGVRDDSEAVRWFRQAADGGLAEAQYNLGIMYASGRGVPRDYSQAAVWYEKAAQQGLAEAQFNLGTLHGLGRGVPRDEALAARWLERAAKKGLAEAQYNLGALFEHGRGVRLDGHQALQWYRQAADQGFEPARVRHAALARKLAGPSGRGGETPVRARDDRSVAVGAQPAPARPAAGTGDMAGAGAEGINAVSWVASLDPALYTLQLASFSTASDATRFMEGLRGNPGRGVYTAVKGGNRYYSVVYGSWATYAAAEAAVATLAPRLRAMKPWVRKVALIHQQMN